MSKQTVKFKIILYIISLMQLYNCSLFSEYVNNIPLMGYYVTSTSLLTFNGFIESGKDNNNYTCEIQFETNVTHKMVFQFKEINVVDSKTKFISAEVTKDFVIFKGKYFHLVDGFVLTKQPSSSVTGYIKNSSFYGTVFIDSIIYYVEDLGDYPEIYHQFSHLGKNAVVFKENVLEVPFVQSQIERQNVFDKDATYLTNNNNEKLYKSIIGNGKVCSLFILIDNSFLKIIHKDYLESAAAHALISLEESHSIFCSTDFDDDGYPDNVGFRIKYFVVIQSEESPMNILPKYSKSPMNVNKYLRNFAEYKFLNEVCLGIVFTAQTFSNNVLGGSFTVTFSSINGYPYPLGGICDRPYRFRPERNFNVLVITAMINNVPVPRYVFDLTLAHELGHSFGSRHDTSRECIGYLMTGQAPRDRLRKRFLFSSCSKKVIMKTIISKGHCFENYEKPFCGNGIVEKEESCDCGTIRDCNAFDLCCIPRGRNNSCKVNKNDKINCHPSQGICCTADCKYNNLSHFDLDCRNFEKSCPCQESESCRCGIGGTCTANMCSSEECTRISLTECDCPTNVNQNKCKTCCLFNNSCLPSYIASEKLISSNRSLIMALKLLEIVNYTSKSNFSNSKKFCDGSSCVQLNFRETNSNEYCLMYGQVGICNEDFQCVVPKAERIYPSLRVLTNNAMFVPFSRLHLFSLILLVVPHLMFALITS